MKVLVKTTSGEKIIDVPSLFWRKNYEFRASILNGLYGNKNWSSVSAVKKQKYKFRFQKRSKTVSAFTQQEAMLAANKHFPLGAGCWFADDSKTAFKWVEGNFFD